MAIAIQSERAGSTPLLRAVMPELDVVRGIAILSVLIYHGFEWSYDFHAFHGLMRAWVWVTSSGWLGVNLFFVLSGFLITGILLDSKTRPDYYRRFYVRRALRILPAYYAILLLLAILRQSSRAFLVMSFFYLSNSTTIWGIPRDYGVLWSLAVEEHFYLLWPAIVRKLSRKHLEYCAIALILVTPAIRGVAFVLGFTEGLKHYTWFVSDALAVGASMALLLRRPSANPKAVRLWAMVVLLVSMMVLAVGAPFGILTQTRLLGAALQVVPWNCAFASFIAFAILIGTGTWKTVFLRPSLIFLGYVSYGLYLIHILVFRLYDRIASAIWPQFGASAAHFGPIVLRFIVVSAVSITLAYLSRHYFEAPFLRLKEKIVRSPNGRTDTSKLKDVEVVA